jgi:hypothetical protein
MTNAKGMARLCCESAIPIMPDEAPHRSESAFEIARETAARV